MIKIYFIIGTASGGTSAAAGALALNGFYCDGGAPYFEGRRLREVFDFHAAPPAHGVTFREYSAAQEYIAGLAGRAAAAGFDRAVLKVPNGMIWRPELIKDLPVSPVLVWRDPGEVIASLRRRWGARVADLPLTKHVPAMQAEILNLHDAEGWPLFRFSKDAGQAALAEAIGVPLPIAHIRPEVQTP